MRDVAESYGRVPVEEITVGERLRRTDPTRVEALAKSIEAAGLKQPIGLVAERDGTFALRWGAHRLAAIKSLDREYIDAMVVEAEAIGEDERRLDEMLENLIRYDLTKLDRARALAELKDVHERLYPQTRNGAQGGRGSNSNESEILAFSKETADQIGLSRRSIEIAVSIWHGLTDDSRERLQGTSIADHQSSLKELSQQSDNIQKRVLDLVLAQPPEAASVADALILLRDGRLATTGERTWRRAYGAIEKLSPKERAGIFEKYEVEIRALAKKRGWF